jgi:hypothetical protein
MADMRENIFLRTVFTRGNDKNRIINCFEYSFKRLKTQIAMRWEAVKIMSMRIKLRSESGEIFGNMSLAKSLFESPKQPAD